MRHNLFWAQGWGVPRDREADGNKTQHHGQTDGDIEQGKSQRKGQAGGGMCGRRGRYIIGTEKMNLQGIMCGTYRRGALSQSKLADLVCNAVHNVCWAVVLLATYCCCAEAEPPTAPEASEVQAAAAAASTD